MIVYEAKTRSCIISGKALMNAGVKYLGLQDCDS